MNIRKVMYPVMHAGKRLVVNLGLTTLSCAASAALLLAAGNAPAQGTPGPWLPITNITAQAQGNDVSLGWDDFSGLVGLQLYATDTLEPGLVDWQPVTPGSLGIAPAPGYAGAFPLSIGGLTFSANAPQKFFRLRGVRGPAGVTLPPFPPGVGGGTDADGTGYISANGPDGLGATCDDVRVSPASRDDVLPGTGIIVVPPGSGGDGVTQGGIPVGIGDPVNGGVPDGSWILPDGTIVIPSSPDDGTPKDEDGDGRPEVGPGDIIVLPPYDTPFVVPAPGGEFDPSIPGIVTGEIPPRTILIPSGVIDDGTGIVLPGPDGNFGTEDDVKVSPAGPADVDPGTGIVTVPGGGASVCTNGTDISFGNPVNGTTLPEGTLVLPDGTVIVPSTPPDGTPAVNPDGTVTVGEGDVIFVPPYDRPFVVPAPGGEFDPSIPGIVTGEVPPRTILIPSGVIDDGTGIVLPGPDGNFGTDDDVRVSPAGPADVDPGTGIVTVPGGGASVSTNGTDVSFGDPVNGTTLPEGTLVLPDGTVIVPSTPPDGTPAVNPDGTVTVGEGDVIFVPPYDKPYVVPAPGGTYVPGQPPSVVLDTVPPTTVTLPPETQPGYPKDPAVAWSGVEATIMIDLTNNCLVTTLPADYAVTNDAASKTAHLYLRKIKAGQFMMGMPSTEVFHQPDAAQKLVTLSKAFYVGVYEVTAYQYGRVDTGAVSGGKTPKVSVSWSMLRGGSAAVNAAPAGGWLKKLTDAVAANPANAGLGLTFDLPTEAQWEFAARAGTAGTYSDSDVVETAQAAAETRMGPLGWWSGNSGAALHEVGLKAANHAGLYDVHGNASEWCRDAWDSSLALPGGTDPLGLTGTNRALRGGGYSSPAVVCRSAARASTVPGGAGGVALGFRLSASAVSP